MKVFSLLLLFMLAVGCQKEASLEEQPAPPSIIGTWKFESYRDSANYQTSANPCLADNLLTFTRDSVASLTHGPCRDENFPLEAKLGRWSVSKDQVLTLDGRNRKIRQLTDSTLWFGEDTGNKIYEFRWKR